MTGHALDREFWERRWAAAGRRTGDRSTLPNPTLPNPTLPNPTLPNPTLTDVAAQLPAGRVLDAGCGEGVDAVWLAEHGWNVTAVDFVDSALQRGRARARRIGADVARRIDWRRADLSEWTPPPNAFDLVSAHYLHGIAQRHRLFESLAAAVRPGGTLLIVGHHRANADISGATLPSAVFFTTDDVVGALGGEWDFVAVDDDVPRHTADKAGQPITLRSAMVAARRGPAPRAG
jgi:2-polyprenyl-3-methyl-5-hydroxy-6-metoxy-1,4-benzoquinol methylase